MIISQGGIVTLVRTSGRSKQNNLLCIWIIFGKVTNSLGKNSAAAIMDIARSEARHKSNSWRNLCCMVIRDLTNYALFWFLIYNFKKSQAASHGRLSVNPQLSALPVHWPLLLRQNP